MPLEIPGELSARAREADRPGYAVEASAQGLWILTLWGPLPLGWAGNLGHHCAVARMSVRDGEAVRLTAGRWAAVFHLLPDDADVAPRHFDFASMSLRRPRGIRPPEGIRLHKATVERDLRGVEAEVRVEAEDRPGLLAFLLNRFAALYLYPVRLSVRTAGARALDRFALTGVGGSPLAARALDELERDLGALCGDPDEVHPEA